MKIREYETGTETCPVNGEVAVYRLWQGTRHCFCCGADHEVSVEEQRREAEERQVQDEYQDRYAPMATESDAHREWHRNSGIPVGYPGCPQDACHAPDFYWPEETETGPRCGNRHGDAQGPHRHASVEDIKSCYAATADYDHYWAPARGA